MRATDVRERPSASPEEPEGQAGNASKRRRRNKVLGSFLAGVATLLAGALLPQWLNEMRSAPMVSLLPSVAPATRYSDDEVTLEVKVSNVGRHDISDAHLEIGEHRCDTPVVVEEGRSASFDCTVPARVLDSDTAVASLLNADGGLIEESAALPKVEIRPAPCPPVRPTPLDAPFSPADFVERWNEAVGSGDAAGPCQPLGSAWQVSERGGRVGTHSSLTWDLDSDGNLREVTLYLADGSGDDNDQLAEEQLRLVLAASISDTREDALALAKEWRRGCSSEVRFETWTEEVDRDITYLARACL